jgi:outer membrane receptor protein involved in Fe transport
MNLPAFPCRAFFAALRVLTVSALVSLAAHAAEEAKRSYNVPAGDAAVALRQFSETSGREVLFAAETVRGVRTPALRGDFTSPQALAALLGGTGLVATPDAKSGAFAVRKETAAEAKNASGRPADAATAPVVIRDGAVQLERFEITDQRTTGLVNLGVIRREEKQALAFTVLDRAEIEATGATDINEVLRTLPQVAAFESESQSLLALRGFATFGAGVTPATKVDLRGFTSAGTTILVNGRRLPLVREGQNGGPDLGRIPLSAIDRIEVLPSSAGGMFGTNSMGGVINVILRKDFKGRELTLSYGQATAGGSNETGITYTEGRSLFSGKANLTWTLDLRQREPMYYRDRPLYRSFLERNPAPNAGGTIQSWDLSGGLFNFSSVPGVIVARNNTTFAIEPLNIPGATGTVNYATVPSNQDGTNLTPASFLAGANQIKPYDPYGDFVMFNPSKSTNFNATLNQELIKNRLSWYAELGFGYTDVKSNTPPTPRSLSLTATDPRNPFRTGVVPGYPGQRVQFYYYPTDLPGTFQHTRNITLRSVVGFNGKFSLLGHDWRWALDGSSDYNARKAFGYTPDQLLNSFVNAGVNNPRALGFYQFFADHERFPNANAAAKLTNTSFRQNDDYVWLGSGVARLNGAIWELPAGPVQVSLLGEYYSQSYENVFKNRIEASVANEYNLTFGTTPGVNFATSFSNTATTRATVNGGAELVVPVLGRGKTLLGIHAFDLLASTSRTAITDSLPFSAHNLGLRFAPIPDVSLRVSFGSGTYPPQEFMTVDSTFTDIVGVTTPDPRRGNTAIGSYQSVAGGNPDLVPEQTRTWNFGLVLEPRFLKGFSATFDYGFIEKEDGITTMPLTTLLANEQFFPGRVRRAAPTAAETALGWAGQIVSADVRRFNAGMIWTQYLDTSVRYNLSTRTAGSFNFILRATNTREFKSRLRFNTPIIDTLDQIQAPLKFRGSGSIGWRKGNWSVTPSWSFIESYRDSLNVPIDSSFTTNLQVVYNLPSSPDGGSVRRLFEDTQWTVGVNNLFDREPPYVYNPGGQNFRSYYSTFDDPRGRYVYLRIKKTF